MKTIVLAIALCAFIIGCGGETNEKPSYDPQEESSNRVERDMERAEKTKAAEPCRPNYLPHPNDVVLAEYGTWKVTSMGENATERMARIAGGPDGCHMLTVMCNRNWWITYKGEKFVNGPPRWAHVSLTFPDRFPEFVGRMYQSNQRTHAKIWFDGERASGTFPGLKWSLDLVPDRKVEIYADADASYDVAYRRLIMPIGMSSKMRIEFSVRGEPEPIEFDLAGSKDAIRDIAKRCGIR